MNKEFRKMNDEQMAMVAGGVIRRRPFDYGEALAQQEERARLQKEAEERWCREQARLNAQTDLDCNEGLLPARIFN